MSGDRYGWIPLPYMIEKSEFHVILNNIQSVADKLLLSDWYSEDKNQIPVSYVLKERSFPYDKFDIWNGIEK